MRLAWLIPAVSIVAAAVSSCGDGGGRRDAVPVPRRYAYPRVNLYDNGYVRHDLGALRFDINRDAVIEVDSVAGNGRWLTLRYPRYNSTMYVTATSASRDDIAGILENRLERMSLNNHSALADAFDGFDNAGFYGMALYAPQGSMTPVQFMTTDSCRWVVSGAVFMDDNGAMARPDSIKPVVEALMDDAVRLMMTVER